MEKGEMRGCSFSGDNLGNKMHIINKSNLSIKI